MLCEPTKYAWNPPSLWISFTFGLKKIIKFKKITNGGTFIIVVCFHEDSPVYIQDVELDDDGSNVKKNNEGGCSGNMQKYT